MSSISSDNLHHFTKELKTLKLILLNGFYPKINIEDVSFILKNIPKAKLGYPVVCFCDLPPSLVSEHKKKYGSYGISLSKEWAIKNKINPVLYVADKDSLIMNIFRAIQLPVLNESNLGTGDVKQKYKDYFYNILCFSAFMRAYESDDSKQRFYDDREWRYLFIDDKIEIIKQIYFNDFDSFNINDRNEELKKHPLLFDVRDIKNLFVKNDYEKDDLIKYLSENENYKNDIEYIKSIIQTE